MNKTELKLGQIVPDGKRRYEVIDAEAANKEVERWLEWNVPEHWLYNLRVTPTNLQLARGFKELEPTREDLEAAGQVPMELD